MAFENLATKPGHPFSSIPLLLHRDLLTRLKLLVTIDETAVVRPTGIPPFVMYMRQMKEMKSTCCETLQHVIALSANLTNSVHDAVSRAAADAGHVTVPRVLEIISQSSNAAASAAPAPLAARDVLTYTHGGKFWDVPKKWSPPICLLKIGWSLWLLGQENNIDSTGAITPVKPFRKLKWVPRKEYLILQTSWRPIFELMEKAPGIQLPAYGSGIPAAIIDQSFDIGFAHVRNQVEYLWIHPEFQSRNKSRWSTATWSKHVKRSSVLRYGTESDVSNLPECNTTYRKRRRSGDDDTEDTS